MNFLRNAVFTLLFCCVLLTGFAKAQISPTDSKTEKDEARIKLKAQAYKLLDEAIGDAETLKLWENRALSYAIAGDLLWKKDQKRAKKLFQDSADELIRGATQPESKTDENAEYYYWQQRSPRSVIMLMIANHDADLALKLLKETRSDAIQTAIDNKNLPKPKGQKINSSATRNKQRNSFLVGQELGLEQRFALKAAEQNPQKAAKIIRESLKQGVAMSAINLLPKVLKKNEDLGKELQGEIVDKLINSTFSDGFDSEINVARYILTQSARPDIYKNRNSKFEAVKFEKSQLTSIANKVSDYYLKSSNFQRFFSFADVLPDLEKYAPSKVPALKQKEKEMNKIMPEISRDFQETLKIIRDPKTTVEELVQQGSKNIGWQKAQFYEAAVQKGVKNGETEKVRQLIKNEPPSKQRNDALNNLNSRLSSKAIKDGKLEEAKSLIEQSETNSARIKIMVDLAIGFEKKNTEEDHKNAVSLMEDASSLVNQVPESRNEVADILKVASGFAMVEPNKALPYLNNLIYMANDLLTAYALIAKYNKRSASFKNGEIIFTQNISKSYINYGKALSKLAENDYGKTVSLIDQFQRQDVKMLAKLLLVQSILNGKISLEGNRTYQVFNNF